MEQLNHDIFIDTLSQIRDYIDQITLYNKKDFDILVDKQVFDILLNKYTSYLSKYAMNLTHWKIKTGIICEYIKLSQRNEIDVKDVKTKITTYFLEPDKIKSEPNIICIVTDIIEMIDELIFMMNYIEDISKTTKFPQNPKLHTLKSSIIEQQNYFLKTNNLEKKLL